MECARLTKDRVCVLCFGCQGGVRGAMCRESCIVVSFVDSFLSVGGSRAFRCPFKILRCSSDLCLFVQRQFSVSA